MDSTFIHIILTILAVGVLWGAYEVYRIREELIFQARYNMIYPNGAPSQQQAIDPNLFDQEQP